MFEVNNKILRLLQLNNKRFAVNVIVSNFEHIHLIQYRTRNYQLKNYNPFQNFHTKSDLVETQVAINFRSSHQRCSLRKGFLEISKNLQENTCARVSFSIKKEKKRPWHRCFPVNFAKFLGTPFLENTSGGCF